MMTPTLARMSVVAAGAAATGLLLSYAWVAVRVAGAGEPPWVVPLTMASEIGALLLAATAIVLALVVRRRADASPAARRTARLTTGAGVATIVLAVVGNVAAALVLG